ncbi:MULTISPECIES: hypothetical protein [unclassified Synechococcus]|jgi:hypothetical protein|uniref:hypothetical protein n=1 Tax=unclassified Synechococcus TaxID=2626047 RepID=UPI001F105C1F|nr:MULTISPECIES: hypothetical protein [unclassified Synechococcus]
MALSNSSSCAPAGSVRLGRTASLSCNRKGFIEGGHQLEKLEFALAVAMTRGDEGRSALLRAQIDALGGNVEEPGT